MTISSELLCRKFQIMPDTIWYYIIRYLFYWLILDQWINYLLSNTEHRLSAPTQLRVSGRRQLLLCYFQALFTSIDKAAGHKENDLRKVLMKRESTVFSQHWSTAAIYSPPLPQSVRGLRRSVFWTNNTRYRGLLDFKGWRTSYRVALKHISQLKPLHSHIKRLVCVESLKFPPKM